PTGTHARPSPSKHSATRWTLIHSPGLMLRTAGEERYVPYKPCPCLLTQAYHAHLRTTHADMIWPMKFDSHQLRHQMTMRLVRTRKRTRYGYRFRTKPIRNTWRCRERQIPMTNRAKRSGQITKLKMIGDPHAQRVPVA